MKKVMACILFIGLGLALSYSPVALASTSSVQGAPQKNARKAYLKQQKEAAKKGSKGAKEDGEEMEEASPYSNCGQARQASAGFA